VRNKIKHRQKVQDMESPTPPGKISIVRGLGEPPQRTIEILPEGVGDFPILHFCRVRFYISH